MGNFFDSFTDVFRGDKRYWNVFARLLDVLAVSALWILCSLPVITAGAATAALYCVTRKLTAGEEPRKAEAFFRAFRVNFRQATAAWLLMLALGGFLAADLWLAYHYAVDAGVTFMTYLFPVLVSAGLVWLMTTLWLFPYIARFTDPLKTALVNSLRLAFHHIGWTALMLLVNLVLLGLALRYFSVLLVVLPGLVAALNSRILTRQFLRYTDPEEYRASRGKWRRDRAEARREREYRRELE